MEPMAGAVWQAFAVILPVRTVGVMGDYRTYAYQVRQLRDMIEEFRLTLEDSS
jgi:GMP synthase PP-ATPase subunit